MPINIAIIQGEVKMELLLIVVALLAVGAWWIWSESKHSKSGSHPLDGPTKAPEQWPFPTSRPAEGENKTTRPDGVGHESIPVMPTLTAALDVNKDGKVDLKDAKAAVEVAAKKTKTVAKKAKAKAVEVKEKAKKAVKKPAAKKTTKSKSK